MDLVLQLVLDGIANGGHYALLALGFGLIFNTTGIVHFAYGPIYALAAYFTWALVEEVGLPLPLATAGAVLATALLGVLSYRLLYRPFEHERASSFVILTASLGLFIALANVPGIVFGTNNKSLPDLDNPVYFIGDATINLLQALELAALVVVCAALALFLRRTRAGQAIQGMTDNAEMARIVGIDTERVKLMVFALGSAIAAIAAALYLARNSAFPGMGFRAVFTAFVAVIIGGVGSLPGAVIAGLLLGLVEGIGMWKIPTEWQTSIAFVVLFVVLLVRPSGLFRGQ